MRKRRSGTVWPLLLCLPTSQPIAHCLQYPIDVPTAEQYPGKDYGKLALHIVHFHPIRPNLDNRYRSGSDCAPSPPKVNVCDRNQRSSAFRVWLPEHCRCAPALPIPDAFLFRLQGRTFTGTLSPQNSHRYHGFFLFRPMKNHHCSGPQMRLPTIDNTPLILRVIGNRFTPCPSITYTADGLSTPIPAPEILNASASGTREIMPCPTCT
jgi:hypothetical protein